MSREEHPNVSAARITGRTAIIVAVISAVSGWAVAGLTILNAAESEDPIASERPLDETEIGALKDRLRCTSLELDAALSEIPGWKEYMEVTAETTSNASLRQSRTATWKENVNDVVGVLQRAKQYADGQRQSC